jgi:hypothetical protein
VRPGNRSGQAEAPGRSDPSRPAPRPERHVRSCHDPPASASAGRRISRARQDDEDLVVLVDVLLAVV